MWIGKVAIIMYAFSFMALIAGAMVQYGLGLQWSIFQKEGTESWTAEALDQLMGQHEIDVEANPTLIFGDFFEWGQAISTLLFGGITGGIVQDMFSQLPFWNEYTTLIVRFMYTFSGFLLALHIGTGRIQ